MNQDQTLLHKPLANFINVLRVSFLYERHFGSFFKVHVTRKKLPKRRFVRKMRAKNVDEIDTMMIISKLLLTTFEVSSILSFDSKMKPLFKLDYPIYVSAVFQNRSILK